jgi:hypothetical protein
MRYASLLVGILLFVPSLCSAQVFRGYNEDGGSHTTERVSRSREEVRGYYPDGTLRYVVTYKRGKLDGDAREYFADGVLKAEARFRNGRRDGIARYYYPDGMLKARILFDRDKEKGKSKFYNEEGVLSREEGVSAKVHAVFESLRDGPPASPPPMTNVPSVSDAPQSSDSLSIPESPHSADSTGEDTDSSVH